MAAAYLFHLCQNHAFIGGNKRVGANAAITFLLMNDWEPSFNQEEPVRVGKKPWNRKGLRSFTWICPAARPRLPLTGNSRNAKSAVPLR